MAGFYIEAVFATTMVALLVSAGISALVCITILVFDRLHGPVSWDSPESTLPQKIHDRPAPRIGGFAVLLGFAIAAITLRSNLAQHIGAICCISFAAGLAEDITRQVSPEIRYSAALMAGVLAYVFLEARITRLSIDVLDDGLALWPLSLLLTVFAIASFAHAVNLIDGLHGLAAGLSILSLIATAIVANKVGDFTLATVCWMIVGALLGFFLFNFPWGRIFLGDGGAYLTGTALAVLVILLVHRNPGVSPWFALTVLAHPVIETLLTVVRRLAVHQSAIGLPDRFHLHSLLYLRLLRTRPGAFRRSNALATLILLLVNVLSVTLAVMYWQKTTWLALQFLLFAGLYVLAWRRLMPI